MDLIDFLDEFSDEIQKYSGWDRPECGSTK